MQDKSKIEEINKLLPRGGKILISKRTGFTIKTVSSILKGNSTRLENRKKVFVEAENIIKEYQNIIS